MEIWPHFRNSKLLRKAISILVVQSFILSSIAFADPLQNKTDIPQENQSAINPNDIVIQKDHGLVKSKFAGNSKKIIINIQDAHCNYEAQTNIVNILEGLINNYNVSLISVEGADGLIDTTWFKAFPDEEVRKEVATYFMKKGEITGPEYLSITKDYKIKLFGAEDRSSYIQNLNAFTSSYPLKADTEKYYNSIKGAFSRLKGFIYNDGLKAMDAKCADYESKKLQFNDYIRFLQEMAEKTKINIRSYDNFFRLVSVLIYEKKIDFTVTDKERSSLIDELSKLLPKDALTELVSQSIAFKSGKISSAEFYGYLKKSALDNDIDVSKKYPNLYNYIIYNSVYSRIENEKLFSDIKSLETAIKEKLFTTDDQRTLDKLSRHVEMLLGMVNIKLMNGDFSYYQTHRDEFTHEVFTDFIKKEGVKYGLAYEVEPPTESVAKAMPKLEDFYAIATKRDKALIENTLAEMDREKQDIAVLVTGGFHSEGMAKLLEKQGVSYVVVCPTITKDVPTPYIQILTNQKAPFDEIMASPETAKKGMLAAILRTELLAMSPKQFEEYFKGILLPKEDLERLEAGFKGKIEDIKRRAYSTAIRKWLDIVMKAVSGHSLARDEKFMKDRYCDGVRLNLKKIGRENVDRFVADMAKSPAFDAAFHSEFSRAAPQQDLSTVSAGTRPKPAQAAPKIPAADDNPKAKTVGATLAHELVNEVIADLTTDHILVLDNGNIVYPQYADVVEAARKAVEELNADVFTGILASQHINDPALAGIFTKENLLKLFGKGSGFKIWLVQPRDKVPGVKIPGILMTRSGSNYGHYSTVNNCGYIPQRLIEILRSSGNPALAQKKIAGEVIHEMAEYMVLKAVLPGKRALEHRDDIGQEAHYAAELLEAEITGHTERNRELILGPHSALDDTLDDITEEYFRTIDGIPYATDVFRPEQLRLLEEAAAALGLGEFDKGYLEQVWAQSLLRAANSEHRPKLRIVTDLSRLDSPDYNPNRDGNFRLVSMLTPEERKARGAFDYVDLSKNPENANAARKVVVTLNSLDGGIGQAIDRTEYLRRRKAKKMGVLPEKIKAPNQTAKATDLGYDLGYFVDMNELGVKEKGLEDICIAEAKLLQLIQLARKNRFAGIRFEALVNYQSRESYIALLKSECVYDRSKKTAGSKRTYRELMEASGIEILDMVDQADLPMIEKKTGNITIDNNPKKRQPGGHGQFGFQFLCGIFKNAPPRDGKSHIRVFYNGDNVNGRVSEHIAGFMARNNMPIVKLTTAATPADKKGGKDGDRVTSVNGKRVYVSDQMEIADARKVGQYDEFVSAGLEGKMKGTGTEPFNTNIFYINSGILHSILNEMVRKGVITEKQLYEKFSPTLIDKDETMIDGQAYIPIDGAIGTAMHSLNELYETNYHPEMTGIRSKYGKKLLYFVDIPRTEFFTPVKSALDMWLQNCSDYYDKLHTDTWMLYDAESGTVPPELDVEHKVMGEDGKEKEVYWNKLDKVVDSLGENANVRRLRLLKIRGMVIMDNARMAGNVIVINKTGEIVNLRNLPGCEELFHGNDLVLQDISITIKNKNEKPDIVHLPPSPPVGLSSQEREDRAGKLKELLAKSGEYDLSLLSLRFGITMPELTGLIRKWGKEKVWKIGASGWFSYLEIIDNEGLPTGRICAYYEVHNEGILHRSVAVLMIAPDGRFVVQTRNDIDARQRKDMSVSGQVEIGETAESAAFREIQGETGFSDDFMRNLASRKLYQITNTLAEDGKFRKMGSKRLTQSYYMDNGTFVSPSKTIQNNEIVDLFVVPLTQEETEHLMLARTEEVSGFELVFPRELFADMDDTDKRSDYASTMRHFFEGANMRQRVMKGAQSSIEPERNASSAAAARSTQPGLPSGFSENKYEWVPGMAGKRFRDRANHTIEFNIHPDGSIGAQGGLPIAVADEDKAVVDIFGEREGFANGVQLAGRSAEEIEADIIQNILGLNIPGKETPDYITAIDLLPRYWDYKAGLYTHGETKHRAAWGNYFTYLTGLSLDTGKEVAGAKEKSVVYNELRDYARGEAKKVSAKTAVSDETIEKDAREFADNNYARVSKAVADVINWKPQCLTLPLREYLTNLYALDTVRTTMKAILSNDPKATLYNPHAESNAEANRIALSVVRNELRVPSSHDTAEEIERWLKLAVGGNIMDLNNPGIRDEYEKNPAAFMRKNFDAALKADWGYSRFGDDFRRFCNEVILSRARVKLVYFLDNNGEAVFDLAFIQKIMRENPNLTVYLVPKKGQLGDDASYEDISNVLNRLDRKSNLFDMLKKIQREGRFTIVKNGPEIQGVDANQISGELADALEPEADRQVVGLFCGQANFETTQGWNIPRYYKLLAKGEGLQRASGLSQQKKPYVFAYIPAGVPVGTGDGYYKKAVDPKGDKLTVRGPDGKYVEDGRVARQTLVDFEEAVYSDQYRRLVGELGGGDEEKANAGIMRRAQESGKTFAEIVFDCDIDLYESLVNLGLLVWANAPAARAEAIEKTLWGHRDDRGVFKKSEFRRDVERLAGVKDLVDSQRVDEKSAEIRARSYLRAVALRTASAPEGKGQWKAIKDNQAAFNRLFGSTQLVAVAGRGSRYSRYVHKALVTADQGDTNVRLAINGSYRTPGTKPIIVISPNQLRWIVKDEFIPHDLSDAEAIDKGRMPQGWSAGVIPEAKIDPRKLAKYFTRDAIILLGEPLGHGYVLTAGMTYLKNKGSLEETAYKQIVFGEMATAQDETKSNSSLITYMEAVIGGYRITAGGKVAEKTDKGEFGLEKKGNFFLRDGKLVGLTDWDRIPKDKQEELSTLGKKLKNWKALPYYERQKLQKTYAIDSEGSVLINSNTVVFRNGIEEYFAEFNDRERHPNYWVEDEKTGIPLSLAWDFIDLVSGRLVNSKDSGSSWPIGFVDVGNAPSSIKDVNKQDKFTRKHKEVLRGSLDSIKGVRIENGCDIAVTLDPDARFDLNNLSALFNGKGDAKGIVFGGKVRLSAEMTVGDSVTIVDSVFRGKVDIGNDSMIEKSFMAEGTAVRQDCSITNSIIPAGRVVDKSVKGLMGEELALYDKYSKAALAGAVKDFCAALGDNSNLGRYTSLAGVLAKMLSGNEESSRQRVYDLLGSVAWYDIDAYGDLLRQMIAVSFVFDTQPQLFAIITDLEKVPDASPKLASLNFEIIIDAIDEQSLTFDNLESANKAASVYPRMNVGEWSQYYRKTTDFFKQILASNDITPDKKREILTELIHRYHIQGEDVRTLYETAIGTDVIGDLKQNWQADKGVRSVAEVLVGEELLKRLDRRIYNGTLSPQAASKELEAGLNLAIGKDSAAYDELLLVFGGVRGRLNGFIDRIMQQTGMTFKDIVLAEKNPRDNIRTRSADDAWEKPRFLAFMGGTGGKPTLLMENLLDKFFGGDITMAVIGMPHDDGGSSRTAQDDLIASGWGYVPSPGDPMNVLSASTMKEGDPKGAKRDIIRTRFEKGEKLKHQAEKLGIKATDGFTEWITAFLQSGTQELVAVGYVDAPLDWLCFIKYARRVAKSLDDKLVSTGKLRLAGGSVGNFLYIGQHVHSGAMGGPARPRVGESTYNPSLHELAQNLGLRNTYHLPTTLDPATLYIKLEASELIVDGSRVQFRGREEAGEKVVDIKAPGLNAAAKAGKSFATRFNNTDTKLEVKEDGKTAVTIGGVQALMTEDFGDEIRSDDSKTMVTVPWVPGENPVFKVAHGKFRMKLRQDDAGEARGLLSDKPESVSEPLDKIDIGKEYIVGKGTDMRAARVKVLKGPDGKITVEVRLDVKGQGTTINLGETPVVFRGRLVIEQTNITESLHTSRIIETGFIDGARPTPNPKVLELIKNTQEMITIGPGSIVTSTLPILMVPEIVDALRERRGKGLPIVFIANPFKDNETVDATIGHIVNLLEQVINKNRTGNERLKAEDVISHVIVNNSDELPPDLRPLMFELTDEKVEELMAKPRDAGDFAGPAKLSRGPLDISEKEMRELSGIRPHRESLATNIWREKRVGGKAEKEPAIGYDARKLGQIIEHIILEQEFRKLPSMPIYQRILANYYDGDKELLNADIKRLLYEGEWLYTPGMSIRTPLEVLNEIERKRREVESVYIGSDVIANNPPKVIFSNVAHTLLRYKHPSPADSLSVEKLSDRMGQRLEDYLNSGGVLVLFTALSLKEIQNSLIKPLAARNGFEKSLLRQIVLAPYAGTRVWRFTDKGELAKAPLIDYRDYLTDEQRKVWESICEKAENIYGLNKHLYETVDGRSRLVDGPVVVQNRDGVMISFEMDGRRNLPDQVVAEINGELAKRGPPKHFPQITKVGILNDERDAVVKYLNKQFVDNNLPLVAEKGGTGAINMRLRVVDRGNVAKEIMRRLNKEAIKAKKGAYKEKSTYVIGKSNEGVLAAFPEATGVYFREEPTSRMPNNAHVYAGSYGLPGVEQFFTHLPFDIGAIRGNGGALTAEEHGPRARALGVENARAADKEGTVNGAIEKQILARQARSLERYIQTNSQDRRLEEWVPPQGVTTSFVLNFPALTGQIRSAAGYVFNVIIIKGLSEELRRQNVAPDQYFHYGVTRQSVYLDEDDFIYLLSQPNGIKLVLEALRHENTHIKNPPLHGETPDEYEARIEKIAPTKNIRAAFAARDIQENVSRKIGGASLRDVLDNPDKAFELSVPELLEQYGSNVKWAIDRMQKSTAGTRGLLDKEDILSGPQLNAAVIAFMAQGYAEYINANFPPEQRGVFVGFDPRYFSKEFAEIFTRVFLANGIKVYRDTNEQHTQTPVTSYMAYHLKLACGIEITSSHNPPNQNGVKSMTWYGGVDTDDVSARIASHIQKIYDQGIAGSGAVTVAPYDRAKIQVVDAKKLYYDNYMSRLFDSKTVEVMKKAMDGGARFIFDGLYGVGGPSMEYYLGRIFAGYDWRGKIVIMNAAPDSSIGGIEKPDPSNPKTLELSGVLEKLASMPGVLIAVTADMDADRIGTAVIIPNSDVARAKKYGLFVSQMEFGGNTVNIVRFTPNQVFTLISYNRILQAYEEKLGIRQFDRIKRAIAEGRAPDLYLLTSIPSSLIAKQMIETFGGKPILTTVGFKNLGYEAQKLDSEHPDAIIISLMEESGGSNIGPFTRDSRGTSIHRDKDTIVLAFALFASASALNLEKKNMLDLYVDMAEKLGGLFYYERIDAYLPNQVMAESINEADQKNADAVKQDFVRRYRAIDHVREPRALQSNLDDPNNVATLASLFGKSAGDIVKVEEVPVPNTVLLVGEGNSWQHVQPMAKRFAFKDREVIEVFHTGREDQEGPSIALYDPEGKLRARALLRASGTESLIRVYLEIFESRDNPQPANLYLYFRPLLEYLGLQNYSLKAGGQDYLSEYIATVDAKYDIRRASQTAPRELPRPEAVTPDKRVVMGISGGEAPGVNSYFALAAEAYAEKGMSVEVMNFGLNGLLRGKLEIGQDGRMWVNWGRSGRIKGMPGAFAGTSRVKLSPRDIFKILWDTKDYCKTLGLIGGNDHLGEAAKIGAMINQIANAENYAAFKGDKSAFVAALKEISNQELSISGVGSAFNELKEKLNDMLVIALPKTIDRDTKVYPIGAKTAHDRNEDLIRRAAHAPFTKEEIDAGKRACSVVQVMGRDNGYLAAVSGNPTYLLLLPEWSRDVTWAGIREAVKKRLEKYGTCTVVASEGFGINYDEKGKVSWPIIGEMLERYHNPILQAKHDNIGRDAQGNPLVSKLVFADFVATALAADKELGLIKRGPDKNLFLENPGYGFRATEPGPLDMAVAETAITMAAEIAANPALRQEWIGRGGVCIAADADVRTEGEVKNTMRARPLMEVTGKIDLTTGVIFTEAELNAMNIIGRGGSAVDHLPDLKEIKAEEKPSGISFKTAEWAIDSQAESLADMARPDNHIVNICVISRKDESEGNALIGSLKARTPASGSPAEYVMNRTKAATSYVTSDEKIALADLAQEIADSLDENNMAHLVISDKFGVRKDDKTLNKLIANPICAELINNAQVTEDGMHRVFGARLADLLGYALKEVMGQKAKSIRSNILGESLNRLPGEEEQPAPPLPEGFPPERYRWLEPGKTIQDKENPTILFAQMNGEWSTGIGGLPAGDAEIRAANEQILSRIEGDLSQERPAAPTSLLDITHPNLGGEKIGGLKVRTSGRVAAMSTVAGEYAADIASSMDIEASGLQDALVRLQVQKATENDMVPVIILFDTGLVPTLVAQAGEKAIKRYLGGSIIEVRGIGAQLLEKLPEALEGLTEYKIVTIAGDQTLDDIKAKGKENLNKLGRIINVKANGNYIPIIGLYDLALRLAHDLDLENILQHLNTIAVNGQNQMPFTIDDLRKSIITILPKIGPVTGNETEIYKAAEAVLRSL